MVENQVRGGEVSYLVGQQVPEAVQEGSEQTPVTQQELHKLGCPLSLPVWGVDFGGVYETLTETSQEGIHQSGLEYVGRERIRLKLNDIMSDCLFWRFGRRSTQRV